ISGSPPPAYAGGGDPEICDYVQQLPMIVPAEAKGRGNTSWNVEKKHFNIKLANKASVLGMPRAKDWTLINNYCDKSMVRNPLAQHLAAMTGMEFVLKMKLVDFWYNGRYMGTYLLSEKKEVDPERINIPAYYPGAKPGDIGYLLEFDSHAQNVPDLGALERPIGAGDYYRPWYNPDTDKLFFRVPIGGKVARIKSPAYPKEIANDRAHITYICDQVEEAINALYSRDYSRIEKIIDVRSFIKWYIVQEYLNNHDTSFHASCFMYLKPGGKLEMGPVWDADFSSGNCDYWNVGDNPDLYRSGAAWFYLIFEHKQARDILLEEWQSFYARTADLLDWVDDMAALVYRSQRYNFQIWDVLDQKMGANPPAVVAANTYEKQVALLKNWLAARRPQMNAFYQEFCK
ncbi:MAG: CotH kinase family protein, partial [Oscillospiraceae bacterium]|nr:CotH kinase family protein [Oscillospiraceae bacterium]